MSASIAQSIDALCKEKGVDRDIVIEAMKEAVRAAARKQFKGGEDIDVEWSAESGFELFASKVIVEEITNPGKELSLEEARELAGDEVEVGDELQLPLPMEDMGRIAAQTAKQILFQKVRDAERANIYELYIDKVGDLINGYVKRFERGDMIVDLGTVEAILPRKEQSRGEQWTQGERIRVVIDDVSKEAKGPQVIGSRTSPELLKRLFEMEVPEIYDGTVVIKSAVREPGERAKIAVSSIERDVDPVGACVGMKGSRVQAIIRELRGEKIDIIEWSDEPSVFAANALSPAKVNQVRITDIERRQMEVIVNEDQLSLAIGKRGQNVRLATKLVGWNIDIRSEEEIKKEVAAQMGAMIASGEPVPIDRLEGMTVAHTAALAEHGINDIDALAACSVDELTEFLDISLDEAERIISSAQAVIAASREQPESEAAATGEEGAAVAESASDATTEVAAPTAEADSSTESETTAAEHEIETPVEQHAVSAEFDPESDAGEVEPSLESTNEGYDEAVEGRSPYRSDGGEFGNAAVEPTETPVSTEADAMSADELLLQETGRDLRPDTITPAPDISASEAAVIEYTGATMDEDRGAADESEEVPEGTAEFAGEHDDSFSPTADFDSEASAPEVQVSSAHVPAGIEEATTDEDVADGSSGHPDNASGNPE